MILLFEPNFHWTISVRFHALHSSATVLMDAARGGASPQFAYQQYSIQLSILFLVKCFFQMVSGAPQCISLGLTFFSLLCWPFSVWSSPDISPQCSFAFSLLPPGCSLLGSGFKFYIYADKSQIYISSLPTLTINLQQPLITSVSASPVSSLEFNLNRTDRMILLDRRQIMSLLCSKPSSVFSHPCKSQNPRSHLLGPTGSSLPAHFHLICYHADSSCLWASLRFLEHSGKLLPPGFCACLKYSFPDSHLSCPLSSYRSPSQ